MSGLPTQMVSFDEARRIVFDAARPLTAETLALAEALGRVLAEDVVADADLVPYARSAMDGYAVRAADAARATSANKVRLPIAGKVLAEAGEATLAAGTTLAITTGAPIPHGADAVIPHEQVECAGDAILVSAAVLSGDSIFPPAEDVRRGDLLIRAGDVLHPAAQALLAFVGRTTLRVHRRPCAAIVCTGNELVDVAETPRHGQIRNSNAFILSALVRACGADARFCGTASDDRAALAQLLESARAESDLLITTGGASTGERDLVKQILTEFGATLQFRAVSMRPGKPTGFATWDGLPVCILPGNPAAVFVGFHELVRPALLRMAGRRQTELPCVRATLRAPAKSKALHRYILLARLELGARGFEVTPLANQCSVLVRSSAEANALIVLPEGPAQFSAGESVEVQVLDWERVARAAAPEAAPIASASASRRN